MDQAFPEGVIARGIGEWPPRVRRGHDVVAGTKRLPLLALDDRGFVVAADEGTRLRGFVDIMHGGRRLARRLVVCAWSEDGMVGYEFKGGASAVAVAPDYAPEGVFRD